MMTDEEILRLQSDVVALQRENVEFQVKTTALESMISLLVGQMSLEMENPDRFIDGILGVMLAGSQALKESGREDSKISQSLRDAHQRMMENALTIRKGDAQYH